MIIAIPHDGVDARLWKNKREVPFTVVTGRRGTPHESIGLTKKMFRSMQQSGSVLIGRDGKVNHAHSATMPVASYDKSGITEAIQGLPTRSAR